MNKFLVVVLIHLWSLPVFAEDQTLAKLFSEQQIEGTLVIASLRDGKTFIHNDHRANQRLPAASIFKIPNTLISLDENAISGKDDVFEWDGHVYDHQAWNHDQTLESAFQVSCVWCFQELARRVGASKYPSYIDKSAYGELREPFEETTFWLDGSLQISATEQVNFLRRVYLQALPFKASSYETLRQIMRVEETPTYTMWAKSGWAASVQPQVGWFVGYVETSGDVWLFATNIEIRDEKDLPLRQQLTKAALKAKGIIK